MLADPEGSGLYGWVKSNDLTIAGSSITEGIGNSRVTANLEGAPIDDAEQIPDAEALQHIFDVLIHEGLSVGTSSGINIAAAVRVAKAARPGTHGGDDPGGRRLALSVEAVQPGFLRSKSAAGAGLAQLKVPHMSLRIAIGGFLHESHSFAPRPTTYADFVHPAGFPPLTEGEAMLDAVRGTSVPAAGALAVAEAAGVDGGAAGLGFANPAGPVQDEAFERIAALICAALSHALDAGGAGWRVSRSAWRRGGGQFPGCGRRVAAPGPRHRRRSAADHQPRSARQPDAADGRRWRTRWCRSAPIRMSI